MNLGQIAVTVSDVGKARAFYRDVLGLRFLFQPALWIGFVRDPDGNLVGLMEEKR